MDGWTTKPAVQVSATSGTRWAFEPESTTGLVCRPPRAGSFRMPKPVVLGPYSSLTFGARMSRDRVPRIRIGPLDGKRNAVILRTVTVRQQVTEGDIHRTLKIVSTQP